MTSPSDSVLLDVAEGVATLTFNRPEVRNAMDEPMVEALFAALERIEGDDRVRCLVLRGAGGHFVAGGDIRAFRQTVETLGPEERQAAFERLLRRVHDGVLRLRALPVPVLAAVQGAVAGGGFALMLACDLVLAAEDAVFTLAYCHLGTTPDGGASFHLPRMIGLRRAMELALLGDRFDAATAERIGLVNRVVPVPVLAAETATLAARLAAGPTLALARTKALFNQAFETGLAEQLEAETRAFAACSASRDFTEGVTAFLDKRRPRFQGH